MWLRMALSAIIYITTLTQTVAVLRSIKNPINFIGNAGVGYLSTGFVNNQYLSDYYIENASFLRLDNINIGYNAGRVFNNKAVPAVNLQVFRMFL